MTPTGSDHEHSEAITTCARFLASTKPQDRPTPLVPAMREMFGLAPVEVCAAIRESYLIRERPE